MTQPQRYHEITEGRKPEFVARGYKGKHFFPYRVHYLPRPLPEQVRTAKRIWSIDDPDALWCLLMFGDPEWIGRFPEDLFFDPQVMIHQEHMGRPGLIATAHLYIDGDTLCTDEHQSDLVQRIYLRREHKSQIEKRFGTWHHMLLNSILNFAVLKGLKRVRVSTAEHIVTHYFRKDINPEMFERLYNRNVQHHFDAKRVGGFWVIDVDAHRDKLIPLTPATMPADTPERSACLLHDIDWAPAEQHDAVAVCIDTLLQAQGELGITATYNVPGAMLAALREPIEQAGHTLAMRSFDDRAYRYPSRSLKDEPPALAALTGVYRRIDYALRSRLGIEPGNTPTVSAACNSALNAARRAIGRPTVVEALRLCRGQDYYLRGYRMTERDRAAGLSDTWLREHHFEWVIDDAANANAGPVCEHGLMRLPVTLALTTSTDDWPGKLESAWGDAAAACIGLPLLHTPDALERYAALIHRLEQLGITLTTPQQLVNAYHFERGL